MSIPFYTINVSNRFEGTGSTFYLFQTPPSDSEFSLTHVVQVAPPSEGEKDGSSSVSFVVGSKYYALAGSAPDGFRNNVAARSIIWKPVKLGPDGSVFVFSVKDGKFPVWNNDAAKGKTISQPGAFKIIVDDSLSLADLEQMYIGVGIPGALDEDIPIPIATFTAQPKVTFFIEPKLEYYIATGDVRPGNNVHSKTVGKYVRVDFTDAQSTKAFIVYNSDGSYSDDDGYCAKNGIRLTNAA